MKKIFYGWWIVLATFMVLFIGVGSIFHTVGVVMEPLQETFGWNRTQISMGFTIAAIFVGVLSPVVGIVVSRIGVKRVQIAGVLLIGIGILIMSFMQELWQYYVLFVVVAMGLASISLVPSQTIISNWFDKKRGTAMGIVMTGVGLGGMAMVFLFSILVDSYGLRWAYRIVGLSILVTLLPLVVFIIKNKPEELGLEQDGRPPSNEDKDKSSKEKSITVKEALKTITFYQFCLMVASFTVIAGGMTQHAIALMRGNGIEDANFIWSLTLGISVIGRIMMGALSDKFSRKILTIILWGLFISSMGAILLLSYNKTVVWAFAVIYGFALGGLGPLFPTLLGERFGIEHFSKLVGITGLFNIVGLGTGAIIMGRVYDATASYTIAIQALLAIAILGFLMSVSLGFPKGRKCS
ncbi:MAG: MFS transporter [Proteobacteria bacterium]|nr:MFS transporter [Pseudomonadota bacterium]